MRLWGRWFVAGGACLTGLWVCGCAPTTPDCTGYATGIQAAVVSDASVDETSGLAASKKHDGVLWAHNDRGDHARIFALGLRGTVKSTVTLRDVSAVDFEDIAVGPGPDDGQYIYVADTGDNEGQRAAGVVYRFKEPEIAPSVVVDVHATVVNYPDGPVDIEALMVDPWTGEALLISKGAGGQSTVYSVGSPTSVAGSLDLDALLGRAQVTGADISADGATVALRTPTHVFLWPRRNDESVVHALAGEACSLPIQAEQHGESVAFAADGSGLYTLGEGLAQPLWFYEALAGG